MPRPWALPVAALELDSIESLLRGQTDLISSFEVLLQNSSLDGQATQGFLASFDDLSARQQAGLDGFNGLVSCNWNDLSSGERMKFTASFEDLLRRQAMMISANEQLLMRGYCLLSPPEKAAFLSSYEQRVESEQKLLADFQKWILSQKYLNDIEKDAWYGFLASYEDLIRRQARLIAAYQELLYSSCEGTFFAATKSGNRTDVNASETINYTFTVKNTGNRVIKNLTINDSIFGVVLGSPGATLLPSESRSVFRLANHSCQYCSGCVCRICDFALVCGDVYSDAVNKTHVCILSNEVCANISQPSFVPVYPG